VSDLFDEIKEDVRKEKYALLWEKFGNYVLGACLSIVLITAGVVSWKGYSKGVSEEQGSKLFFAEREVENDNIEAAYAIYDELINEGRAEYASIAGLKKAALLVDEGRKDEASLLYQKISDISGAPIEIKELAGLLYIYSLDNEGAELSEQTIEKLSKKKHPWRFSAAEFSAFRALKENNNDEAKELFNALLGDPLTPPGIRKRSQNMIDAITRGKI